MRIASKTFAAIGLFGLFASVLFALGNHSHTGLQGFAILFCFAIASEFLALVLWRTAAHDSDAFEPLTTGEQPADEEIHLPGPSIWPAGYGVSLLVLVLGLVFSLPLLIAGVVLTVLVTIGWALESVRDYRREIAHHKPSTDRLPASGAAQAARALQLFSQAHGGGDAVVQHLGRGTAEIVVVGADGEWGNIAVRSVAAAQDAVVMAGLGADAGWDREIAGRLRTGVTFWERMGATSMFTSPKDDYAPRDGTTQVGSKLFFYIGLFALVAAALFALGNHRKAGLQGTSILTCFAVADFFLAYFLRMARARPSDGRFAAQTGVTMEPTEPDPPVDLATLHLPGPSIWPAGYGVALGVLVIGLVFSLPVLVAGIVATVLVTIGWALESVRDYRASIAGHGEAHPGGAPDRDPGRDTEHAAARAH